MPAFVLIGMGLIFIGILVIAIGSLLTVPEEKGVGKARVGVGGFIGPIPFGFGTDKTVMYVALGISAFILVMYIVWHFMR